METKRPAAKVDDLDALADYSRRKIERGSKSFAVASRLFDQATRADAQMLYAWCRYCDDVIDGQDDGYHAHGPAREERSLRQVLGELELQTRAALGGRAEGAPFQALARVVERHGIPSGLPLELLEGFRMDVEGRHYARIEDTLSYCYHVAGVVGVMMARIMGVRDRCTLLRAHDLGIAFQLTNIARDIVEDARNDRVYLPEQWLKSEGLTAADVSRPEAQHSLARVAHRMLDVAESYYVSANDGLAALPFRSAWAVASARQAYRGIGDVVRRRGNKAWSQRAVVSSGGKGLALAQGLGIAVASRLAVVQRPRPVSLWTKESL